ncbi:hypothetical protein PAMP_010922 [Pampus punctatissimus]
MMWIKCVVFLVTFLLLPAKGDDDVYCAFTERCILPCRFQAGPDVVVHWIQVAGEKQVHSYYHNQDQLAHQDQRLRGRTSLFKEQISRGDASLLLTGVEVQDQGKYSNVQVVEPDTAVKTVNEAPVSKVDIQQEENSITCRSNGIFPKPELTWSTSPESNISINSPNITQSPTEPPLFNISSSLILSDNAVDLTHICTVRTHRSSKRAALMTLHAPLTCFVWIFNHSQTILTWTGDHYKVSEWKQQVKNVTRTGNLTLEGLSKEHEGMYTCEFSNPEGTNITNTFLRITGSPSNAAVNTGVVVGVVVGVLAVVAVSAGLIYKYGKKLKR